MNIATRNYFLICIFTGLCLVSLSSSAQYGRLENMSEWDTVHVVMRTPKETLKKLAGSPEKKIQKQAKLIEQAEQQLEILRRGYLINRLPTMNIASFTKKITDLETIGVDVRYYVQEFFIYHPRDKRK